MRVYVCVHGTPLATRSKEYVCVCLLGLSLVLSAIGTEYFGFYDREAIFIVLLLYVNFNQAHTLYTPS